MSRKTQSLKAVGKIQHIRLLSFTVVHTGATGKKYNKRGKPPQHNTRRQHSTQMISGPTMRSQRYCLRAGEVATATSGARRTDPYRKRVGLNSCTSLNRLAAGCAVPENAVPPQHLSSQVLPRKKCDRIETLHRNRKQPHDDRWEKSVQK